MLATLTGGATSLAGVQPPSATLRVLDTVVSIHLLKNRLLGIQVLEIIPSAVITPAARDYCNEHKVAVVRSPGNTVAKTAMVELRSGDDTRPQRLLVAGTASWMPSVAKQLCTKQAMVCPPSADDSSALRTILQGLRAGHQAGVAIVNSAHATCWQAARDEALRPAVVSSWPELNDVLREVPVNVLILPSKTWNIASACNCARLFFQHLQKLS